MEISFKVSGFVLMASIAVLQFFLDVLQYPATRWVVAGVALLAVVCFAVAEVAGDRKRRRERIAWESGQVERDRNLLRKFIEETKPTGPSVVASVAAVVPPVQKSAEVLPNDPRVYPVSIKETENAFFPETSFVVTNRGGDVAHKVRLEMLWKLKGRNVAFPVVETIAVGESAEILPAIGEGESGKHDIFHWLMDDWNANAGGLVEEWPKEMNVRWQNFNGEKFVCALTFVFHPIDYMLKRNGNWPAASFIIYDFRNIQFNRE